MDGSSFGLYLRSLRTSRKHSITQEELACAIGRSKMTISQFEQGKNAPPQGELLDNIITALSLDAAEERKLRFLSAEHRRTIPGDIEEYFFKNPSICEAIRIAQKIQMKNSDWDKVAELFGGKVR